MSAADSDNGYHHDPADTIARLLTGEQIPIDHLAGLWLTIAQAMRATPAGTDPLEALYAAANDTEDGRSIIRAVLRPPAPAPDVTAAEPTIERSTLSLPRGTEHDDLMNEPIEDEAWLVSDLIPAESLVLLAGAKKRGKSWLTLQLAQAVAAGSSFLGRKTQSGRVLYFCLEDGRKRTRRRLRSQHACRGLPITWYFDLAPLDHGGARQIEALTALRTPTLIVIDTITAARGGRPYDENATADTAPALYQLQATAQRYAATILIVVHHGKRASGDDVGHDIRGSSSIAGAADATIGLYRTADGQFTLRGEGRDLPDFHTAISFDTGPSGTWSWHSHETEHTAETQEPAPPHPNATHRQAADAELLTTLSQLGAATAAQLADELGRSRARVSARLARLAADGLLTRTEQHRNSGPPRAVYALAPSP